MQETMPQGEAPEMSSDVARFGHFLKRNKVLLALGAILEAAFLAVFLATQTNNWNLIPFLFFGPFSIYLVALWWVSRRPLADSQKIFCIVIVFAIVFRLTLLFSGPVLSLDMYRYYWDGRVAANGINPYLYPPDAPELSFLRDANWELINHKYLRAGYPPLLELFFEFLYVSFHSAQMYKVSFFVFDMATILAILLLLRQLGIKDSNLIIYAWAPLPIVEISQTGHNDSMVVFLMMVSFLLLLRGRRCFSSAVMGLSVVSKFFPIFFAPVLFRRWGVRGTLTFFGVIAAFHAPFLVMGPIYYDLLYAVNTSFFNGSLFPVVTSVLGWTGIFSNPGFAAQLVVYCIYAVVFAWAILLSWRGRTDSTELMRICFLLTGTLLLLNRTFFPWYMTWMLPFVALYASTAWLLLSGSIFLGYMKYDSLPPPPYEGVGAQTALGIDLLQYLPFYVLLVYELVAKRILLRTSRDL